MESWTDRFPLYRYFCNVTDIIDTNLIECKEADVKANKYPHLTATPTTTSNKRMSHFSKHFSSSSLSVYKLNQEE